jgi:hypothetical protein
MGDLCEVINVTLEVTPQKVKGRREPLNLECFINYDGRGSSLGGGKGKTHVSSVKCLRGVLGFVVLWVLHLRACQVSGFVGSLVVSFEFLAYLEPRVSY